MEKLLLLLAVAGSVLMKDQMVKVLDWVAHNPTMWTNSVGYLIPFLIFVAVSMFFTARYFNQHR